MQMAPTSYSPIRRKNDRSRSSVMNDENPTNEMGRPRAPPSASSQSSGSPTSYNRDGQMIPMHRAPSALGNSFGLFEQSFDTGMSMLRSSDSVKSGDRNGAAAAMLPSITLHHSPIASSKTSSKCNPSSQAEKNTRPQDAEIPSEDYSLGELSPIKVDFLRGHGSLDSALSSLPTQGRLSMSPLRGTTELFGQDLRLQHSFATTMESTTSHTSAKSADPHEQNSPSSDYETPENAMINPFVVMRAAGKILKICKHLLPCIRQCDFRDSDIMVSEVSEAEVVDTKIASRRVGAAICAFGGTLPSSVQHGDSKPPVVSAIFRLKASSAARQMYKETLRSRYKIRSSRISWEVEEHSPVEKLLQAYEQGDGDHLTPYGKKRNGGSRPSLNDDSNTPTSSDADAAKLKYRCKKCGQPKQNHNCPFRQSLQRNIGVMVYPAVNAYTAAEPGIVAPSLTRMNNFVSYESSSEQLDDSPLMVHTNFGLGGMPPRVAIMGYGPAGAQAQVTPELTQQHAGGMLHGTTYHSPQSSVSLHSDGYHRGPYAATSQYNSNTPATLTPGTIAAASHGSDMIIPRKRLLDKGREEPAAKRALFVQPVTLRPEHYRAVTEPMAGDKTDAGYDYAAIPLTYAERKRLSDTLFFLSQQVPQLTADCATVLRTARATNDWDQAVAELLTQVVIGLYCTEHDVRLEGLQHHLLALGVAC